MKNLFSKQNMTSSDESSSSANLSYTFFDNRVIAKAVFALAYFIIGDTGISDVIGLKAVS